MTRCPLRKKLQRDAEREKRRQRAAELVEYKRTLTCYDCGMSFADRPECADFHHLEPEIKRAPRVRWTHLNRADMWDEIAKCVPLCANCHRTRHAGEE